MDNLFLTSFITAVFSFGTAIFYVLTCIERSTFSLVRRKLTNETDIRFTHEALKRLSPLLPPSNGFVILFGVGGLVVQCVLHNWYISSLGILSFYLLVNLYIIFGRKIAKDVSNIKMTSSESDLKKVSSNVRNLIINHHLGLLANLGVVLLELILFAI